MTIAAAEQFSSTAKWDSLAVVAARCVHAHEQRRMQTLGPFPLRSSRLHSGEPADDKGVHVPQLQKAANGG